MGVGYHEHIFMERILQVASAGTNSSNDTLTNGAKLRSFLPIIAVTFPFHTADDHPTIYHFYSRCSTGRSTLR